jgi:hypothetical protein
MLSRASFGLLYFGKTANSNLSSATQPSWDSLPVAKSKRKTLLWLWAHMKARSSASAATLVGFTVAIEDNFVLEQSSMKNLFAVIQSVSQCKTLHWIHMKDIKIKQCSSA